MNKNIGFPVKDDECKAKKQNSLSFESEIFAIFFLRFGWKIIQNRIF
jgi:hypothetical protein